MHKSAARVAHKLVSGRLALARGAATSSALLEPEIRKLRPFDLPDQTTFQPVRKERKNDPESINYYETRQYRFSVPRHPVKNATYASLTKALYAKEVSLDEVYQHYEALPSPRPLHLQPAELEQLLTLVMSSALRDKHTIKRLVTISEDMKQASLPLSIKEVNTLVYLVLRERSWQRQYNPNKSKGPTSADMQTMMTLLSGDVEWPVSTFNIALDICKTDPETFEGLLHKMEERNVKWDASTAQIVFRYRLKAVESAEACLQLFYSLYSDRHIEPQDINILVWGLLRAKGYEQAVQLVSHLSQFSTSDITNSVRKDRKAFKSAKLDKKKAARTSQKQQLSAIEDIPPTVLTDNTFSMLLTASSSFADRMKTLKMAYSYFGELPTRCLQDMYHGFEKHRKWNAEDLYALTEYVLNTKLDYALYTRELFMTVLKAYKLTQVIEERGREALASEANCLEACRLAKTDQERQVYIYIYFKRLHELRGAAERRIQENEDDYYL
ncbi:hypothetical protein CJU89_6448 [Yarrowia sp. B02]|nr:hypothetical protein CJU89_6448 [Yarrowia sp. B02]